MPCGCRWSSSMGPSQAAERRVATVEAGRARGPARPPPPCVRTGAPARTLAPGVRRGLGRPQRRDPGRRAGRHRLVPDPAAGRGDRRPARGSTSPIEAFFSRRSRASCCGSACSWPSSPRRSWPMSSCARSCSSGSWCLGLIAHPGQPRRDPPPRPLTDRRRRATASAPDGAVRWRTRRPIRGRRPSAHREVTHEHRHDPDRHDQRGDRRALAGAHVLLVVRPGRARPDRHRPRRGRLPLHARGPPDPRLQQPADVGQHRPRRPARHRRHHRPGAQARSTSSRRSPPRSARASARSWPRSCPATSTRSSSPSAAPRRSRTPSSSPATYTGRHKILARYRSYHGATLGAMIADRRPAPLGQRARASSGVVRYPDTHRWGEAEPRPGRGVASRASRTSSGTRAPHTIAAIFLETIVGTNGILIPPDGYIAGRPRDLRPARHPDGRRRGHGRLRADRALVRRRPLGRRRRT